MARDTIQLLRNMVAIDSVNPSLASGHTGEGDIAQAVADELGKMGLDVEFQEAAPGRPNVIGVLDSGKTGPSMMFCGHTDTVGVAGMEGPFDPTYTDGKVYGRGSQDMKGGLVSMMGAARVIADNGGPKTGRLIIAGVIDEEYSSIGARELVKEWTADAAVVGEPTDMSVAVGHKGFEWVEIDVEGRAAHGSRPLDGLDAILRMGRVLSRLERLDRELASREPHPLMGTASLHASLIDGGKEWSTYPDRCTLKMERRTVAGESGEISLTEVESIIRDLRAEDSEFHATARYVFGQPPYETPTDHPIAEDLVKAVEGIGRKTDRSSMTFWTDAAVLGQAGIPSVIFGPTGKGLHSIEEYVVADDVLACQAALVALVDDFCS
jgi:acetylornithine deacetylase